MERSDDFIWLVFVFLCALILISFVEISVWKGLQWETELFLRPIYYLINSLNGILVCCH